MSRGPVTVTAPPHPPVTDAGAQALFEEARRRRRHRRSWFVAVVAVCLLAAGVALGLGRGTPARPPGATHSGPGPTAGPPLQRPQSRAVAATPAYSPVQAIGLADGGVGWAAAGFSVYLTTDQGRTWHDATPPGIRGQTITGVVGAMVGIGTRDLWLPVGNLVAPELIPSSQLPDASVRVTGVERSTDGGATWSFSALPGCLQACGDIPSLSFVDAEHGYAAVGADASGTTRIFSTSDGGTTWAPVSTWPAAGDGPSIVFPTVQDGWAVTGPTFGSYQQSGGQLTSAGGAIAHTTDGGVTWSEVPGLPAHVTYALPTFFTAQDGVVLGRAGSRSAAHPPPPVVYATEDGGTTWTAHPVPMDRRDDARADHVSLATSLPFTAVTTTDWKLYLGPALYRTTNAGRSWARSVPTPVVAAGTVEAIAFASAPHGMAMMLKPSCATGTPGECYPVLSGTSDGGRHWAPITLP
jgi:photosystem II stability/assembly factor-like uncharacterized protein